MVIAVTGATGQLGRKVIKTLLDKVPASEIVAVVRDPAKATDLGVTSRGADYDNTAGLEAAFAGIEKLLLISSNSFGDRAQHHTNAIAAAGKAGVKHIVYTGILHADQLDVELASDHKRTEVKLKESGLPHTILRNGWYWENHTANLPRALQYGTLVGSAGEGKVFFCGAPDFAEAAVAVLTGEGHEGKIYELAGDTAHSLRELAEETARASGKSLDYRSLSEADHVRFYEQVGLPVAAAILAEVETHALGTGLLPDESHTLSRLIGRPTTTLEQAVAQALEA